MEELTEEQRARIHMPEVRTIEDVLMALPRTIISDGKSYGLWFGVQDGTDNYYAGYEYFGSFLDDQQVSDTSPLLCFWKLLVMVIEKSWRAY